MRDSEYFLRAMNDIDDKFINEAFNTDLSKTTKTDKIIYFPAYAKRIIGVAAALIVVIGGIAVLNNNGLIPQQKVAEEAPTNNAVKNEAEMIQDADENFTVGVDSAPAASGEISGFDYPQQIQDYVLTGVQDENNIVNAYYHNKSKKTIKLIITPDLYENNFEENKAYNSTQTIDNVEYRLKNKKVFVATWIQNGLRYYFYPNYQNIENTKVFVEEIQSMYN